MKKFLIFWMIVFASTLHAADIPVEIHVDANYKPFSFDDNGVAKGIYIDVLKAAFAQMEGFDVTLTPVPWQRGKKLMEAGRGFGLAPAFFHGHDWPYLYPYSLPFYTETILAVCNKKVLPESRPNWPQDYIDLKIGNVAGFDGWGGAEFRALVEQKKVAYEEAKGSTENILKLGKSRIDCIMMEETVFDYEFRQLKQIGKYDEGGKHAIVEKGAIIGTDPVYIGYSKPARESGKNTFQFEFMQAFDSAIYQMGKSGEIQKIMEAYGN